MNNNGRDRRTVIDSNSRMRGKEDGCTLTAHVDDVVVSLARGKLVVSSSKNASMLVIAVLLILMSALSSSTTIVWIRQHAATTVMVSDFPIASASSSSSSVIPPSSGGDDDKERQAAAADVTHDSKTTAVTSTTAKARIKIPFPVFVASLYKSGTVSVHEYFQCGGAKSVHYSAVVTEGGQAQRTGPCIQQRINTNSHPVFAGCGGDDFDVYTDNANLYPPHS